MRFRFLLVLLLLVTFSPSSSNATLEEDLCKYRYGAISGWKSEKGQLERALAKLPDSERQGYQDALDALYFVNYQHLGPELLESYLKGTPLWKATFPRAEDGGVWKILGYRFKVGEGHSALTNYRFAKEQLKKLRGRPTAKDFARLHSQLFHLDPRVKAGEYLEARASAEVDALLANFYERAASFKNLEDPQQVDDFITRAARLHQELVIARPFGEGSERAATVLLNHILESAGLPPARLLDPRRAETLSKNDWAEEVRLGIQSTRFLRDDIVNRLAHGQPVAASPELLSPLVPRVQAVPHKSDRKSDIDTVNRALPISGGQYAAYLSQRFAQDPSLRANLKNRPQKTAAKLYEDFLEWTDHTRHDLFHNKQGEEELQFDFVEPDFFKEFGVTTFEDPKAWREKMSRWNHPDLMWRGLSHQDKELPDSEILSMFTQVHPHMVSNKLLQLRSNDPEVLRQAALKDFAKYNEELFNGKLLQMARDHTETGPMYGDSYGISTSSRRVVGEGFAMGAMVIAEYGKHRTPEMQAKLKDRILVGAYRGKKDVEISRLRHAGPAFEKFSYMYPRQKEVMAIGAADPDSVMLVQRVGAKGEVVQSWVRNPERPGEVWIIKGEYQPENRFPPPDDVVIRKVDLGR